MNADLLSIEAPASWQIRQMGREANARGSGMIEAASTGLVPLYLFLPPHISNFKWTTILAVMWRVHVRGHAHNHKDNGGTESRRPTCPHSCRRSLESHLTSPLYHGSFSNDEDTSCGDLVPLLGSRQLALHKRDLPVVVQVSFMLCDHLDSSTQQHRRSNTCTMEACSNGSTRKPPKRKAWTWSKYVPPNVTIQGQYSTQRHVFGWRLKIEQTLDNTAYNLQSTVAIVAPFRAHVYSPRFGALSYPANNIQQRKRSG